MHARALLRALVAAAVLAQLAAAIPILPAATPEPAAAADPEAMEAAAGARFAEDIDKKFDVPESALRDVAFAAHELAEKAAAEGRAAPRFAALLDANATEGGAPQNETEPSAAAASGSNSTEEAAPSASGSNETEPVPSGSASNETVPEPSAAGSNETEPSASAAGSNETAPAAVAASSSDSSEGVNGVEEDSSSDSSSDASSEEGDSVTGVDENDGESDDASNLCWRFLKPRNATGKDHDKREGLFAWNGEQGEILLYSGVGGGINHPVNSEKQVLSWNPESGVYTPIDIVADDYAQLRSTGAAFAHDAAGKRVFEYGGMRATAASAAMAPTNTLAFLELKDGRYHWTKPTIVNEAGSPAVPPATTESAVAVVGNAVVVFGGTTETARTNLVRYIVPGTWKWETPTLNGVSPSPRAGHTMLAVGKTLFVYGGFDGVHYFGDLHRLTPPASGALQAEAWEWQQLTPLHASSNGLKPPARAFVTATLLTGSKILLHSGANRASGQYYSDTALLDVTNADSPSFVALPSSLKTGYKAQARRNGAAAFEKDANKVAFFGGCSKSTCHDIFTPQELDMAGVCPSTCRNGGKFVRHQDGTAECVCKDEFGGKLCEQASTCPNDCTSAKHGKCVGGKCVCRPGFTGSACQTLGCPGDCNKAAGTGACAGQRCLCAHNWYGLDCTHKKCEHNCHGRGYCNPSGDGQSASECECVVPHFSGKSCEIYGARAGVAGASAGGASFLEVQATEGENSTEASGAAASNGTASGAAEEASSSGAASNGTADAASSGEASGNSTVQKTNADDKSATRGSETVPGPTFEYKADFSCPDNCGGNGICHRTVDGDGNVRGECKCREGFTGADCNGECTLHCTGKLHGKCVGDSSMPRCECNVGFRGAGCEEAFCARNCSAHGDCISGECKCDNPWTGAACHLDGSCSGHGTFKEGAYCECEEGYGGFRCEQRVTCAHSCGDNGVCVGAVVMEADKDKPVVGHCRCNADYRGAACEKKRCPSDCSGQGSCSEDGKCSCFSGFAGLDCSHTVACPNNCTASHGRCVLDANVEPRANSTSQGVCECEPQWSGASCNDLGCAHQCNRRGDCIEGKCRCDAGYSGNECEVACPRKCQDEKGVARGICVNSACSCFPGWNGTDCSIKAKCPGAGEKAGECSGNGECFQPTAKCFCKPGFSGDDCSQESQCGATQCSGKGKCTHGKCFCNPGFEGEHCERKASCQSDCNGRGVCVNGDCFCNTGFKGDTCAEVAHDPTCEKNCSSNGVCQYGRCFCVEGYTGDHCQTPTSDAQCRRSDNSSALCEGRGLCRFGQCFCSPGFAGDHCERDEVCEGGCVSDQGVCLLGECRCLPGFKGPDCSEDDVCEGTPLPCTGHGVCIQGGCACLPGYAGAACEKVVVKPESSCPNNCTDGGVCHLGRCFCIEGRDGKDCSLKTQDACPDDCNRKGLCRFGQCFCKPGFAGKACEQKLECSDKCLNNGVCAYGHCFCVPGYTGKDCEQTVDAEERSRLLENDIADAVKLSQSLAPKNSSTYCYGGCGGHGTCIDNRCFCAPGYFGSNCQTVDGGPLTHRCSSNCSGNGQCLFGQCFCNGGFTGPHCNDTVVLGCRYNCNGKGTCHQGQCFCDPGFEGAACERKSQCVEECEKGGHGVCVSGVCQCVQGYYGATCNKTNVYAQPRFVGLRADAAQRAAAGSGSSAAMVTLDNCPTQCAENGVCVNSQCYCKAGWSGVDCSQPEGGAATTTSLHASVAGVLGAEEASSLVGGADSAVSYGLLSVLSFAAGVIVCVIGQIAWAKHKEMSRKRATKDIFKPLLHTLDQ